MSEYLSDAEEKEKLIEWWNENGKFIVTGVALGLVGIMGWRFWNTHLDTKAGDASLVYEEMVLASAEGETDKVKQELAKLSSDYSGTAYVAQGHLLAAKTAVEAGELSEAVSELQKAIKSSKDAELAELANFRLAKVYSSMQDTDKALSTLSKVKSKSYVPLVEELRGDIYRTKGDLAKARASYEAAQLAMQETPIGDPNLLQMKLSDLGAVK